VSRRLKAKALAGFGEVRKFSAERLKDLIHIDLIAYAEEVIDNSKNTAKPTYDQVQARLNHALLSIHHALDEATVASKEVLDTVVKRTKLDQLGERVKPFAHHLKVKLQEAIERAKDLSTYGKDYILHHQELSTLPTDTAHFILHVPYLLSIQARSKSHNNFPIITTKIENLLVAIRDVFACLILLDTSRAEKQAVKFNEEKGVFSETNGKLDEIKTNGVTHSDPKDTSPESDSEGGKNGKDNEEEEEEEEADAEEVDVEEVEGEDEEGEDEEEEAEKSDS